MPLLNTLIDVKKYSGLAGEGIRYFKARVLHVRDPKYLGRIKCQIYDLLPFDDHKKLPWVYPLFSAGTGEAPKSNNFIVPEVDTFIYVTFPFDSIYFGYYFAHPLDRLRRLVDFVNEYPERYGSCDSIENKIIVNKSPRVNATERRWSDGGWSVYDAKDSKFHFRDQYGTDILIDRMNQTAVINFSGVQISILGGRLIINGEEINIIAKTTLELIGEFVNNYISAETSDE